MPTSQLAAAMKEIKELLRLLSKKTMGNELGLEPLITPVRSPQSNGMAESFVKTMKHDYIAFMDKPYVPTALSHLANAFEQYNERHPHRALKYRSPREFRRAAASLT